MRNIKKLIAIQILFTIFFYIGNVAGQSIKDEFVNLNFAENFDNDQNFWLNVNNADNFFLIQGGEYLIERKNESSPYAILAEWQNNFSSYAIKSSLKVEQSITKDGFAGLIAMAQADGRGAFFIELGKEKMYRIRQLVGVNYKFLTGTAKNEGWVKLSSIKEGAYNIIDVKIAGGNYDFFINSNFVGSFNEPTYKTGKMGFIIGPGTKAKADFFYVYSNDASVIAGDIAPKKTETGTTDVMALTDAIVKLKTKINALTQENADLKKQLVTLETGAKQEDNSRDQTAAELKKLQQRVNRLAASNDSLQKINSELKKYKDIVAGNENSDLVIALSNSLQKEKANNLILSNANQQLQDSIKAMKGMVHEPKPVQAKQPVKTEVKKSPKPATKPKGTTK